MMQEDKTHPKCFTCGVVGHKSPDCPSKVVVKKEPEELKKKKQKKTYRNNRVSVSEDDLTQGAVMAIVADRQLPLLIDTGAQVTVLPEEAVPAAAKTGNKVRVKGYARFVSRLYFFNCFPPIIAQPLMMATHASSFSNSSVALTYFHALEETLQRCECAT